MYAPYVGPSSIVTCLNNSTHSTYCNQAIYEREPVWGQGSLKWLNKGVVSLFIAIFLQLQHDILWSSAQLEFQHETQFYKRLQIKSRFLLSCGCLLYELLYSSWECLKDHPIVFDSPFVTIAYLNVGNDIRFQENKRLPCEATSNVLWHPLIFPRALTYFLHTHHPTHHTWINIGGFIGFNEKLLIFLRTLGLSKSNFNNYSKI